MVKIDSFEDLKVWQKSRELTKLIYKITSKFPREERFGLTDQIRRAMVSVMANIAEGFSRFHLAETVMFYRNARGSLTEAKSHLYVCIDLNLIDKKTFEDLVDRINEVGKMTNGLIKSTRSFRSSPKP